MTLQIEQPERSPGSSPSRPGQQNRGRSHWGWFMGVSALATLGVVMLVVLDVGPFGGSTWFYVVGFVLVLTIHATLAAIVVGLILEAFGERRMPARGGRYVVIGLAWVVLLVLAAVLWLMVRSRGVGGLALLGLCLAAGVGAAIGIGFVIAQRRHRTVVLARFGAAALGAVATVFAIAVSLVLVAHFRNLQNTDVADPPRVHGITGGYIALGDSYSAGEGLRPFLPGTGSRNKDEGNDCHRSDRAYPRLLLFDPPIPSVAFRACSGAVTLDATTGYDVLQRNGTTAGVPAQVGPPDSTVGLVTLTMGGNDVLFSKVVEHCLVHAGCLQDAFGPRTPARHTIEYPPRQPLADWAHEALARLRAPMADLYGLLRDTYPKARIVVIGYPYLFPAGGGDLWPDDCISILNRFSRSERESLRGIHDEFNSLLYELAVNTPNGGVEFVSPAAVWDGHEPCGRHDQYTNAIQPFGSSEASSGGSFHPNEAGQKTLARLVACYLNANREAPNPYQDGRLKPAPGAIGNPVPC